MPRPKSHSRDDIVAAALTLLDSENGAALSIRRVSRELGMSPMALYRYVADREELERLIADRILADVELEMDTAPWQQRVAVLADRVRTAAGAHPEAIPLLLRHRHEAPSSLRWIETMLSVLADAGFHGTERVVAQRAIVHYLVGAMQSQRQSSLPGAGTAAMAGLSAAEFPYLAETARIARDVDPDEEFHRGLASLLVGLRREHGRTRAAR